jgi:hypothetical protein
MSPSAEKSLRESLADADLPTILVLLLLLVLFVALYWSLSHNENCLMHGFDGISSYTEIAYQANRTYFTQTGADPVQGMFDAYYPAMREYLMPTAVWAIFSEATPSKTDIYTCYSLFLLLSVYGCARAVRIENTAALLAAFLFPVLALPGLVNRLAQLYTLLQLVPDMAQIIGLSLLIVGSFWALDSKRPAVTAFLTCFPALCLQLSILSYANATVLMLPAVALYGGGSLLSSRKWRDNVPRMVAGSLMVLIPLGFGSIEYYRGLVGYSAFAFFAPEFTRVPVPLMLASVLHWTEPFGAWTIYLGLIGAAWTAFFKSGKVRQFAIVHLVATALYFICAYWIVFYLPEYRGPMPVYFESCIWPYAVMFSAVAIIAVFRAALATAMVLLQRPIPAHGTWIALLAIVAGVVGYNAASATARIPERCPAQFDPIRSTPITEIMQREIASKPGRPFRGIAATVTGTQGKSSTSWLDLVATDLRLWNETGNDHRSVGLWVYGIPTLFQYSDVMTAQYYFMMTEFLSRPQDAQYRNVVTFTRLDLSMLKLWGVRYVTTDFDPGFGRIVATLPVSGNPDLKLTEISGFNRGNYSPIEARHAADFPEALAILHDPNFDGEHTVVSDRELPETFTPAGRIALSYESYGFALRAESSSTSLLVLPVQYSHCWVSDDTHAVTLFRANVMQLGVKFTGRIDTRLTFRFGPLFAGACRLEDAADMDRLRIKDARSRRLVNADKPSE